MIYDGYKYTKILRANKLSLCLSPFLSLSLSLSLSFFLSFSISISIPFFLFNSFYFIMFYHLFLSANFTKRCWSNGSWDTSKLDVDGVHILMNYSACKAASKDKVGNRIGLFFFLFWIETRIENFYTSVYVVVHVYI